MPPAQTRSVPWGHADPQAGWAAPGRCARPRLIRCERPCATPTTPKAWTTFAAAPGSLQGLAAYDRWVHDFGLRAASPCRRCRAICTAPTCMPAPIARPWPTCKSLRRAMAAVGRACWPLPTALPPRPTRSMPPATASAATRRARRRQRRALIVVGLRTARDAYAAAIDALKRRCLTSRAAGLGMTKPPVVSRGSLPVWDGDRRSDVCPREPVYAPDWTRTSTSVRTQALNLLCMPIPPRGQVRA